MALQRLIAAALGLALSGPAALPAKGGHALDPGTVPAGEAWRMLREGSERFGRGMTLRPHADLERRTELTKSQHPWAVVLSCSDSRVPPEIVFDAGLGDLFTVRVAGNVAANDTVLGSVEYAVEHLGPRLILVLGHEKCGAVTAAVEGMKKDDHSSVDDLIRHLKAPAAEAKDKVGNLKGPALIDEAVERNVLHQMKELIKSSAVVKEGVEKGAVMVVGGVYSLNTGKVTWLGEHPSKHEILEDKKP